MLEFWYDLVQTLLPFEWTGHIFMKNALFAVLLISPVYGILGTMIVGNRMAFFSDALGHGAFTGIAIGGILGLLEPMWAAIIFSLVFSVAVTAIKNSSKGSADTIIGVFSSTAIAAGLGIISLQKGSFSKYNSYLVGDLLSIAASELVMLLFALAGVILLWAFIFNKLLLTSVNSSLARSRGSNPFLVETVFTSVIAVIVTISIPWVGLLLINSLLVLPAAAARNITSNMRQYHLASVLIALVSGILGLILSYYWNTSTGATIVLISSAIFFISVALKRRL
jgi:zinc transport system permease protein